jgi:hypothetical protein
MRPFVLALVLAAAPLGGCGDNLHPGATPTPDGPAATPDGAPGPDASATPATLADTGLCVDPSCATISPDVHAYEPRWHLWSDGATKRRWIYLPDGAQIDTSDMNVWHFPEGTKLWKEFTRDGTRVETRLYMKTGPADADWYQVAYVWNAAQDQAIATPGGMMNANGTEHDVPSRSDCRKCHDRIPGRILGFSALQLDWDAPQTQLDLDDLVQLGWLSAPPAAPGQTGDPYFALPSDATGTDVAALGYLHVNCGHCHNPDSDVYQNVVPTAVFKLDVDHLGTLADTSTYQTVVGQTPSIPVAGTTLMVAPGDPDHSEMYVRFTTTNVAIRMPPLGTEIVDATAAQTLHDWIAAIPTN